MSNTQYDNVTTAVLLAEPYLTASFLIHTASMLVHDRLSYLIRNIAVSPAAIGLVNVSLMVAWAIRVASVIGASFIFSYLYSLIAPLLQRNCIIANRIPSTGKV
jgi:hypothetical protein